MRHKHADLIHAWAEGAEIERFRPNHGWWVTDEYPSFSVNCEYRIKPEKKPDVVRYTPVVLNENTIFQTAKLGAEDNLKLTFDGETGKLKSADVL